MEKKNLTHIDELGNARMVDVTEKAATRREAVAAGSITMAAATLSLVKTGGLPKGDVLSTARIAGIMGAKQTSNLIPMCHPIIITSIKIEFLIDDERKSIEAVATVKTVGQTGVEMEAITAATTALLTIYDMCKAVDKEMELTGIMLIKKTGGKSGQFERRL
ncbi:cyclic pyranopterin monophosphate synthase MoaC [Candidatus Magnetominusculus dajiuhuensis]|uniref:cyclic pyranopterin monophosphate synthase MoaC n=1 Tax=Candidatus Magnetominusculus dajiuhuensis TaxID=3137712 RepID=UPI003B435D21